MSEAASPRPTESHQPRASGYVERVVRLGTAKELAGILCEPATGSGSRLPVVVMWNVGLNHHVGPYRVFVDLSRQLAKMGFSAIRFDVAGLGDSEFAAGDVRGDSERSIADVRAALDGLVELTGSGKAVLIGFCSSVDSAHAAALEDERVVGLVNVEGYSFATFGFRLRYPQRLLEVNRWVRWAHQRRENRRSRGKARPELNQAEEAIYQREYPTPWRLAREYRMLASRGVRMLCLYVRGDSRYEYEKQLFDFLGDKSLASHMEVGFFPHADHVFSRAADRTQAVARIVSFIRDRFSAP